MTTLKIPAPIHDEVFAMAARGESLEALSAYMAKVGLEKIFAVRLLSKAANIRLGEAKRLIHMSPSWAFRRGADDAFHESVLKTVRTPAEDEHHDVFRHRKTGTHSA